MNRWRGLTPSEFSRIARRKYHEIADEARIQKGWKKAKCAEVARERYPEYVKTITDPMVYDWFSGEGDPHTSFSKIMEDVLDIDLPPQCYWNAGKRA